MEGMVAAAFVREFIAQSAFHSPHGPRLVDQVATVLSRLAPLGWGSLFEQHGLDLTAVDLAKELTKPLTGVDRSAPGFEDFAAEGYRAIEPGNPALSLLYHALASPRVTYFRQRDHLHRLTGFPTLADLETVENFVYGINPPSVEDLRARASGAHLAIVVFAFEYRAAVGTIHRRHADMVYSRTGVARVGTEAAKYLDDARGFLPFFEAEGRKTRVLPCRYGAYVAALVAGEKKSHGPLRFIESGGTSNATSGQTRSDAGPWAPPHALDADEPGDGQRRFWVPIHKLFSGNECIQGRSIQVRLAAAHRNEKIRRAHLRFLSNGHNGGWAEPDISNPPFVFQDQIAELSSDVGWLLSPVVHQRYTEPAVYGGRPLTYTVPKSPDGDGPWRAYSSSLNLLPLPSGARAAPEYVHARHVIKSDGSEIDLNDDPHLIETLRAGNYQARHYVDHTGDGWIDAECSDLALDLPRRIPAYSIVACPDFFPLVDQTSLMQWTDQSVLPSLLRTVWDAPGSGLPQSLSDQRYAANLQLTGANFDPSDDTMTAIVGSLGSGTGALTKLLPVDRPRASMLPDSAAGVFAPGWDVSYDRTSESDPEDTGKSLAPGVTFLTNYGLGSPFMEDSKLCAALSAFWPAAAPDITRTFAPSRSYATATPLTDEIIGLGRKDPWDGVRGPKLRKREGKVEYPALAYADYVQTALKSGFDISEIGKTTAEEYVARTLTMALVYRALGVEASADKLKWSVLSFRPADTNDADFEDAQAATGRILSTRHSYRYEVFDHADRGTPDPKDFKKVLVNFGAIVLLFADPTLVLMRDNDGTWTASEVRR